MGWEMCVLTGYMVLVRVIVRLYGAIHGYGEAIGGDVVLLRVYMGLCRAIESLYGAIDGY